MTRPTWDETWLGVARVVARRSLCDRAQVGAVIVDAGNRIVATGYNGPPAGLNLQLRCTNWCERAACGPTADTVQTYDDCPSIHAERNALNFADRRQMEGGTLYVTGDICWTCSRDVANSGIARVVVIQEPGREYREGQRSRELLNWSGIDVCEVQA